MKKEAGIQVLRIGKISSVNYRNGTARVTYEDRDSSTTVELPFLAWEYWMPQIEDTVLVGHLTNGTASAVILGPIWHNGHRPVEGAAGIYRKELEPAPGASYIKFDAEEKILTVCAGGSTITIKNGKVTIGGDVTITGTLTVEGTIING